jgi:hypothetical protein
LRNVPNPFNGSTQIWYKLEDEASVSISVFDYTGKRVSSISQGNLEKGSHYVDFSSDNLPSGIYFYTPRSKRQGERFKEDDGDEITELGVFN